MTYVVGYCNACARHMSLSKCYGCDANICIDCFEVHENDGCFSDNGLNRFADSDS